MCDVELQFTYYWRPVLKNNSEEYEEYYFPEKITLFMKNNYKYPAIYRWNIFKNNPEDKKLIYIGETQELCPRRINGYLNPGSSQQTNKRIKEKFQNYLKDGYKIRLEILKFDNIKVGNFTLTNEDLQDKHVRCFLEELMIVVYKQKRFKILNL